MNESIHPKVYSVGKFAKLIGRHPTTVQGWDRNGVLVAGRTPTGRRFYTHEQYLAYVGQKGVPTRRTLVYCRVSSSAQKADLRSQCAAMEQFCIAKGLLVDELLTDVGSGLNYSRKNFLRLCEAVERNEVGTVVVAHKDRLVRFGFEWFENLCQRHHTTLLVANAQSLSPEAEMTQDLLSIVHCFSSRLYGLRKYKKTLAEDLAATPK
jgi:predicted site-specific integrase-resolvase